MRVAWLTFFCCAAGYGEMPPVPVAKGGSETALDPSAAIWKSAEPVSLSLQRTPLLYPTDAQPTLDIAVVKLQLVRGSGAIFARIEWTDATRDSTALPKPERAWQTEANVKQSGATDRFADACAIMTPEHPVSDGVNPSLQMGDAANPVRIYFWDATRGPAIMRASGRETTRRTGESFPVRSAWAARKWTVTMQLPELPEGAPVAIALWNGAQQDRDGRKYFSIWYRTR
jgi:hypothetical protein